MKSLMKESFMKAMYVIQRVVLICLFSVYLSKLINKFDYTIFHEELDEKSTPELLTEIIAQTIVIVGSIYFIRKMIHAIPFFLGTSIDEDEAPVFAETSAISLIYFNTQAVLNEKVKLLMTKTLYPM